MWRIKWQGIQFGSHWLSRKESRNGVDSILLAPASFSIFSEYVPLKFKLIDWWHLYRQLKAIPFHWNTGAFLHSSRSIWTLSSGICRERELVYLGWCVCTCVVHFTRRAAKEEFDKMLVCRFLRGCCVLGLNQHVEGRPAWSSVCLWHVALLVASLKQALCVGHGAGLTGWLGTQELPHFQKGSS